ncbi:MAG: TlpA family protein disulfide reductase [Alphaproteobacteria bacterium]|nr:TlpA family protein disulfide reductase [Alphaproteobacteria bacterium]
MKPTCNRFFQLIATVLAGFYIFAAVASLKVAAAAREGMLVPSAAKEIPALSYVNGEGEKIAFATHKGKVVVVHFWAQWCPPCIDEMPEMVASLNSLSDAHKAKLALLPISLDKDAETVQAFYEKHNLALPVMRDDNKAAMRAMNIRGVPSTVILDAEGREIARREGVADWDSPAIRGILLEALSHIKE